MHCIIFYTHLNKMIRAVVGEAVPVAERAEYNALITEFEAAAIRHSNRSFASTAPSTEVGGR